MFMVRALPRPRSETKAAVTVTQQSAICAASSTSRRAQRRPVEAWIPPLLIASFGSVLNICRSGITPNNTPASTEIRNAIRINDGCGRTIWNPNGYSVGGCQLARPVRAIHANPQAHAPPRIEITTASTRIWRTMRQRLDPMAMRMAISRVRSAVRAANRLPRLAQAASSTIPASPSTPPENRAPARRKSRPSGQDGSASMSASRLLSDTAGQCGRQSCSVQPAPGAW